MKLYIWCDGENEEVRRSVIKLTFAARMEGRGATMCPTPRHNGSFYNQLGCIARFIVDVLLGLTECSVCRDPKTEQDQFQDFLQDPIFLRPIPIRDIDF